MKWSWKLNSENVYQSTKEQKKSFFQFELYRNLHCPLQMDFPFVFIHDQYTDIIILSINLNTTNVSKNYGIS